MTWNYRVMHRAGRFAVYSVYYSDDGRITGWSAEPMPPNGESVEDLGEDFERFRRALSEPSLDYETAQSLSSEPEGAS